MNNTLTNGLGLLSLVANTGRAHGVTELANMAELPKSHVHRLLQSLVEARYLEKDHQSRYSISVGALRLGRELLRNIPVRRMALPEMMQLVGEVKAALSLAAPFGHEAISIAHITPDGNLRGSMESLGSVLSAHASASGKLFLAYLPEDEVGEVLAQLDYSGGGPNAHRNAESLKAELPQIRARGYSINNLESGANMNSFAVPIHNQDGKVFAALGASAQANELSLKRIAELAPILLESVQRIESTIKEENP
ncbi:IclR family transcriptional regulator [Cerasicoccus arenae]|uniref:Transcriptional regulator n=1 Tax=Cerasicoccus arenae TaxID=424488 RepID=A0A8J3GD13_9BACT|nr:IclR family transcriptional regulator [Cerasicoccus arenae]MBK1859927.1 IclR family transcriptional regulator [Cerasicoccus arenae]GHB93448.1 transcriptional regulator [Cerasicoccus arenae]